MSKDNLKTGGPAFPAKDYSGMQHEGLSVRDYFAAKALPEIMRENNEIESDVFDALRRMVAREAYQWADAMLEARNA